MTYLNAPQTKMVATHCCVCGRALCDAVSVNRGIGPVCDKRYLSEAEDGARKSANKLVFEASCIFMSVKSNAAAADRIAVLTEALAELGFTQLAKIVFLRAIKPSVILDLEQVTFGRAHYEETVDALIVKNRYACGFNEEIKKAIDWRDRAAVFQGEGKDRKWSGWAIRCTPSARQSLYRVIQKFFQGERALGPKGLFTVTA